MNVNKPNVIVIGASKCGTTALYFYLSRHPDIFLPSKKELHYHSHQSLEKHINGPGDKYILDQICKTNDEYLDYFSAVDQQKAIVEISPSYLYYPETAIPSIIATCGPDTKIICMLRHPVEKLVSQYTHLLSAGREDLDFDDALTAEPGRKTGGYSDMWLYRESGYMSEKLLSFKNDFKNILVINSIDLSHDLEATLHKVFNFIGVNADVYTDYSPITSNYSGMPKSKVISKVFIKPNWFTNFIRKVISQKTGRLLREKINNFNKGVKFTVNPDTFKKLENEYYAEIDGLNKLLKASLSSEIKLKS